MLPFLPVTKTKDTLRIVDKIFNLSFNNQFTNKISNTNATNDSKCPKQSK